MAKHNVVAKGRDSETVFDKLKDWLELYEFPRNGHAERHGGHPKSVTVTVDVASNFTVSLCINDVLVSEGHDTLFEAALADALDNVRAGTIRYTESLLYLNQEKINVLETDRKDAKLLYESYDEDERKLLKEETVLKSILQRMRGMS